MKREIPDYKKPLWQNDERISKAEWILEELVNKISSNLGAQKSKKWALENSPIAPEELEDTETQIRIYNIVLQEIANLKEETHKYQGDY